MVIYPEASDMGHLDQLELVHERYSSLFLVAVDEVAPHMGAESSVRLAKSTSLARACITPRC